MLLVADVGLLLAQEEVRFGRYRVIPKRNVGVRGRASVENSLSGVTPVNGKVNALMQFRKTPNSEVLRKMEVAGVVLENYVGGNAYYAQVPASRRTADLARYGVSSIIAMRSERKVSSLLEEERVPHWTDRGLGAWL